MKKGERLKGIYLHGYKGYVTEEKKKFLNEFGEVFHPTIDYDHQPTILFDLLHQFKDESVDFVAGTSLGGILIYQLAQLLNVPALLLNPAVIAWPKIEAFIPKEIEQTAFQKQTLVIVGKKDDIVEPALQIEFFENERLRNPHIHIQVEEELGHFVPLENFKKAFLELEKLI